jgi:signal transduction histidine kinase
MHTFYVKDNGLGIPRPSRSKIFQAFQRVHPTAAGGEGVGLSLVQRAVARHGGTIWFESEEGVGTTFFVTLPVPTGPPPAPVRRKEK